MQSLTKHQVPSGLAFRPLSICPRILVCAASLFQGIHTHLLRVRTLNWGLVCEASQYLFQRSFLSRCICRSNGWRGCLVSEHPPHSCASSASEWYNSTDYSIHCKRCFPNFLPLINQSTSKLVCAVAAPLCVTVQTALLGKYGGSASQAAFAAVGTTANATCLLFNFLVDGISAKVQLLRQPCILKVEQ